MTKGSAFDRIQERDKAYLPYGRQLLSAPELASLYRGLLAKTLRQFVWLPCQLVRDLRFWAIYEHRTQVLRASRALAALRLLIA